MFDFGAVYSAKFKSEGSEWFQRYSRSSHNFILLTYQLQIQGSSTLDCHISLIIYNLTIQLACYDGRAVPTQATNKRCLRWRNKSDRQLIILVFFVCLFLAVIGPFDFESLTLLPMPNITVTVPILYIL